jgi:hypothetical protein
MIGSARSDGKSKDKAKALRGPKQRAGEGAAQAAPLWQAAAAAAPVARQDVSGTSEYSSGYAH